MCALCRRNNCALIWVLRARSREYGKPERSRLMELVRHSGVREGAQIETNPKPHGVSICFVSASTLGMPGNQSCLFCRLSAAAALLFSHSVCSFFAIFNWPCPLQRKSRLSGPKTLAGNEYYVFNATHRVPTRAVEKALPFLIKSDIDFDRFVG